LGIAKLIVWRVPGQSGREERWDLEIVTTANDRRRLTGVPPEQINKLLRFLEGLPELIKRRAR